MFVRPESLSNGSSTFSHFVNSSEPCVLCHQTKEPKKVLPINCIPKHQAVICVPCFTHNLHIRYKNNQNLICPLPECGMELSSKRY